MKVLSGRPGRRLQSRRKRVKYGLEGVVLSLFGWTTSINMTTKTEGCNLASSTVNNTEFQLFIGHRRIHNPGLGECVVSIPAGVPDGDGIYLLLLREPGRHTSGYR